jgi:hypothetical protein
VEPKAKERRVIGKNNDVVIIEDTSDDEDEETLQQRFHLRSRFWRAGMLDVPVEEPPANLGEDMPLPPRKLCNTARKRAVKKLKVSKDTRQS